MGVFFSNGNAPQAVVLDRARRMKLITNYEMLLSNDAGAP